jgi:Uma2 family endonuclease
MIIAAPSKSLFDQQHIVLDDVSWQFYQRLLEEIGDRPIRVTFNDGSLEMMAPLPLHERWKSRIGRLVEALSEELDIEIETLGSTTFRRDDLEKGLEPDECYYVQHAAAVHGKDEFDLTADPPPDLAIEIDITHRSVPRQPIYAALGVPELWRFDARQLTVLRLRDGTYHASSGSEVFPFLPMAQFQAFVMRMEDEPQNRVLREFRNWLRGLPNLPR